MAYEVYNRTKVRTDTPTMSLVPDGRIVLNSAAVRILTSGADMGYCALVGFGIALSTHKMASLHRKMEKAGLLAIGAILALVPESQTPFSLI